MGIFYLAVLYGAFKLVWWLNDPGRYKLPGNIDIDQGQGIPKDRPQMSPEDKATYDYLRMKYSFGDDWESLE